MHRLFAECNVNFEHRMKGRNLVSTGREVVGGGDTR